MTIAHDQAIQQSTQSRERMLDEVDLNPEAGNGKRYSLWTIGCQMNESESSQIGAALELAGYRAAPNEQDADIIVLN